MAPTPERPAASPPPLSPSGAAVASPEALGAAIAAPASSAGTASAAAARGESDAAPPGPLRIAVLTALAYALVGAVAVLLAGPPGYASPLYPSAGIALVAVLVYGRAALPGALLGSFAVNAVLGLERGASGLAALVLPLLIGTGAALQAWLGAALVRRHVSRPLVLNAPRDIARFSLLGGVVACVVSPSVATPALLATGAMGGDAWLSNWVTWWVGDTMGVLIGAPLALTLVGRPSADWLPRRRTLGLPLLLALALLAAGMAEFGRLDRQRLVAGFERDVDRLAAEAQARLAAPVHALQALHGTARAQDGPLTRETLREAARWWLAQPMQIQAMGYSERVALDALPAYEAAARAESGGGFRVFDRDDGSRRAADREVLALRHIEPPAGNTGAVGFNALSLAEPRRAILASRDSGEPAATAGFRLTQSTNDETGVVIYQALYRGDPADVAARREAFRGVVFVTLRTDAAMAGLSPPGQRHLRWCLVDPEPGVQRPRLAGPAGCEHQVHRPNVAAPALTAQRRLMLGGRPVELRITAPEALLPGQQREATWLLSIAGLAAAAMLGALLLTVTGHTRRTQLAVQSATANLRREMDEHARAQRALAESEARLRSILDHVPLGVMFLGPDGRLIDGNPRLHEMLGSDADSMRGRAVTDYVHPDDAPALRAVRRVLLAGGDDQRVERLQVLRADGTERTMRLDASALRAPDGTVLRMVGVLEDITERLRLEESERALHRAEAANRAKSEFLSRMSHELRTPLNAMIGFAQLLGLDREPRLVPHQREWTQEIQRAGWHLLEMINETLDLARIESGAVQLKMAPVELAPLVQACESMLANAAAQRGIAVSHAIAPGAGVVMGDPTRLKQVLTNLLSNAIKYNREGGQVGVAVRRIAGETGLDDDRIEIAVSDSGLGMTPTQVGGLFQPYNRLGRENSGIEGTGIGLVISRRLVELMGGTLDVRSEPGRGSVFTLRLPAAAAPAVDAMPGDDAPPAPYQQRLVHYIEDNETNVEVMRGILMQRPQISLSVSTLGLDGLAAVRARRPDLILLDMQLPDISGIELLRHLKQDEAVGSVPVVVVSADATPTHIQQALTSGALQYVTKPLDVARFLDTLDGILAEAETRWGL
jgi:PAS domain S-box-containing protein